MCRMRWEYCKDLGGTNNKEGPVDVVHQVPVQVESTGAIREVEDRRLGEIVEGEPADDGVDVPRWKAGAAGGGGKADPAVRGVDDAA